jgi:hypothetical protein
MHVLALAGDRPAGVSISYPQYEATPKVQVATNSANMGKIKASSPCPIEGGLTLYVVPSWEPV